MVMLGVESVVESMVSSWEHRFNKTRNCHNSTSQHEMEVSVNGPNLAKAAGVVERALKKRFPDGYKFQCPTSHYPGQISTVMKRLSAEISKFPCLDK